MDLGFVLVFDRVWVRIFVSMDCRRACQTPFHLPGYLAAWRLFAGLKTLSIMIFPFIINKLPPPPNVTDLAVTRSGQGRARAFLSGTVLFALAFCAVCASLAVLFAVIFFAIFWLMVALYFKIRQIIHRYLLSKRFSLFHRPASAQALRGRVCCFVPCRVFQPSQQQQFAVNLSLFFQP